MKLIAWLRRVLFMLRPRRTQQLTQKQLAENARTAKAEEALRTAGQEYSDLVRSDPRDFTERALRAGACWQVWCEQQTLLRAMVREAVFHGDHPLGETTRFLQELHRLELRETYARVMLQSSLDWLTSAYDFESEYRDHVAQLWGPELAARLAKWWRGAFEPYYIKRITAHAESLRNAEQWAKAPNGATP